MQNWYMQSSNSISYAIFVSIFTLVVSCKNVDRVLIHEMQSFGDQVTETAGAIDTVKHQLDSVMLIGVEKDINQENLGFQKIRLKVDSVELKLDETKSRFLGMPEKIQDQLRAYEQGLIGTDEVRPFFNEKRKILDSLQHEMYQLQYLKVRLQDYVRDSF